MHKNVLYIKVTISSFKSELTLVTFTINIVKVNEGQWLNDATLYTSSFGRNFTVEKRLSSQSNQIWSEYRRRRR